MFNQDNLDFITKTVTENFNKTKGGFAIDRLYMVFDKKFPSTQISSSMFRYYIRKAMDNAELAFESRRGPHGGLIPAPLNRHPKWEPPPPQEVLQAAETQTSMIRTSNISMNPSVKERIDNLAAQAKAMSHAMLEIHSEILALRSEVC